jgi:hypothetical protein
LDIHYCLKCFVNKNVVVASSDAEIYSVVQGDMKTTNKIREKKLKVCLPMGVTPMVCLHLSMVAWVLPYAFFEDQDHAFFRVMLDDELFFE